MLDRKPGAKFRVVLLVNFPAAIGWVLAASVAAGPGHPRAPADGQSVAWPASRAGSVDVQPTGEGKDQHEPPVRPKPTSVPSPRAATQRPPIEVAVGLDPSAPGSKAEKALVDRLERSVPTSDNPSAKVRRLRAGSPSGREVCRAGRDDLVILVGYVPTREDPVLLVHDCGLDKALDLRGSDAAGREALVSALWDEHDKLVRSGVRERRRLKGLSSGARAGIIAGVAIVIIGVAVGVLVASALREETVVIKVSP